MAVSLPPWVFQQYRDDDGVPLAGGTVSFYVAGSDTPLAAYTDATGDQAITNPLVLDSSGYGTFWLTQGVAYKIVLADADGVWSKTIDSVLVGVVAASGLSGEPVHLHRSYFAGDWPDDTPVDVYNYVLTVTYPVHFAGSSATVESYPGSPKVCSIQNRAGDPLGTLTIPATSGALTFACAEGASFAADDQLRLIPPSGGLGETTGLAITWKGSA